VTARVPRRGSAEDWTPGPPPAIKTGGCARLFILALSVAILVALVMVALR